MGLSLQVCPSHPSRGIIPQEAPARFLQMDSGQVQAARHCSDKGPQLRHFSSLLLYQASTASFSSVLAAAVSMIA